MVIRLRGLAPLALAAMLSAGPAIAQPQPGSGGVVRPAPPPAPSAAAREMVHPSARRMMAEMATPAIAMIAIFLSADRR